MVRIRGGKRQPRNTVYKQAAATRLAYLMTNKREFKKEETIIEKMERLIHTTNKLISSIKERYL